jgi:hypothetical protein
MISTHDIHHHHWFSTVKIQSVESEDVNEDVHTRPAIQYMPCLSTTTELAGPAVISVGFSASVVLTNCTKSAAVNERRQEKKQGKGADLFYNLGN